MSILTLKLQRYVSLIDRFGIIADHQLRISFSLSNRFFYFHTFLNTQNPRCIEVSRSDNRPTLFCLHKYLTNSSQVGNASISLEAIQDIFSDVGTTTQTPIILKPRCIEVNSKDKQIQYSNAYHCSLFGVFRTALANQYPLPRCIEVEQKAGLNLCSSTNKFDVHLIINEEKICKQRSPRCIEVSRSDNRPTLFCLHKYLANSSQMGNVSISLEAIQDIFSDVGTTTQTPIIFKPRCIEVNNKGKLIQEISIFNAQLLKIKFSVKTNKNSPPRCIEAPPPWRKQIQLSKKAPLKTGLSYFWAIKNHPPPNWSLLFNQNPANAGFCRFRVSKNLRKKYEHKPSN